MRFSSTAPSAASSLRLGQDLLDRLGPHRPADRGDRAERAALIAPFADSQIGVMPRRQAQGGRGRLRRRAGDWFWFRGRTCGRAATLESTESAAALVRARDRDICRENARAPAGDCLCPRTASTMCSRSKTPTRRSTAGHVVQQLGLVPLHQAAGDDHALAAAGLLHARSLRGSPGAIRSWTLREIRRC